MSTTIPVPVANPTWDIVLQLAKNYMDCLEEGETGEAEDYLEQIQEAVIVAVFGLGVYDQYINPRLEQLEEEE